MTALRAHVTAWWHLHLSVWGLMSAVLVLALAGPAAVLVVHHVRGGYRPAPLPPPLRIAGGSPLPASISLGRFLTRIHNQGNSESCVGQTLATIEEITAQERNHRRVSMVRRQTVLLHRRVRTDRWVRGVQGWWRWAPGVRIITTTETRMQRVWRTVQRHAPYTFSAGFIYDPINGGVDGGASYGDAYRLLTREGDARLRDFPHDGIDFWVQPSAWVIRRAGLYRFSSYRSIAPWDRHTIERELAAGRPIALALPWHDGLYGHFGQGGVIRSDGGAFHFWHSVALIGYGPAGVRFVNSWGPQYGVRGQAVIAWSLLASESQGALVISTRAA